MPLACVTNAGSRQERQKQWGSHSNKREAPVLYFSGAGQVGFCGDAAGCIEDHEKVCSDLSEHILARHISLDVLLEVELEALRADPTKDSQACMGVASH